jgi:hypothetical protein
MQTSIIRMTAGMAAALGIGMAEAQTYAPASPGPPAAVAPAPPPSAYSPSAPASNAAVGTVRRQDRRQFMYEQKQRNDAEDAVRSRAQTAPARRTQR